MVSHDDDVDAAMQVHLLQTVHQLTDDVIDLPQRVVQLQTGMRIIQKHERLTDVMKDVFSLTSLLSGPRRCPKVSGCSEWTAKTYGLKTDDNDDREYTAEYNISLIIIS